LKVIGIVTEDPRVATLAQGVAEALPAEQKESFHQNLAAYARLLDMATIAPSLIVRGRDTRNDYRRRSPPGMRPVVEQEAVRARMTQVLHEAFSAENPSEAMGQALVRQFSAQVGIPPEVAETFQGTPQAVRTAIQQESFVPLYSIYGRSDDMRRPQH